MKNLGADAFRERIAQAQNSFLFEIDVLKREYQLEDPEQKTKFYNATARKLLEFTEALERDNYIHAVAQAQFIPYEDLRRLVNRLGNQLGPVPVKQRSEEHGEPREMKKKKEKDDGIRRSQRLLLTWLIERPEQMCIRDSCGAVSAGCGAGCGIAYLLGGDFKAIAHTLVNGLAIVSGIICDGAKPSCAGKIAAAVDAGILGRCV